MRTYRFALIIALTILQWTAPAYAANKPKNSKPARSQRSTPLSNQERALHLLNRLTFGPRPGDLDRVLSVGIDGWIERQLQPQSIPDAALDARLNKFRTLTMQPREMAQLLPPNSLIRSVAEGKKTAPADPMQAGLYEVLVDRYNQQQRDSQAAKPVNAGVANDAGKTAERQRLEQQAVALANALLSLPKDQRMSTLMQMPVSDRQALTRYLNGDVRNRLLADFSPADREVFLAMNGPTGVVVSELQQAKLLRDIYSERQLEEVMTDFWFNHFNIFVNKDADQYLTTAYERDVIRPHALGKFRDLLVATAQSPAMLFYLDNWTSAGPNSQAGGGGKPSKPGQQNQQKPGLNENYARELMELHTLGVDGGYTQADVTEVARVFTGWTIQGPPEQGGQFQFDAKKHDPGPKSVLGHTIPESGQNEGLAVLNLLASSPATAKFVCTKLARRFVSDDPPVSIVNKMTETWTQTDGDISQVLRAMLRAPEFWSRKIYRARIKTPLEFVASTMRATGTDVSDAGPLVQALARMGMPLYQMLPPTGYSTRTENWMSSDALLDRFNFSIRLTSGNMPGAKFDADRLLALGVLTMNPKVRRRSGLDGSQTVVALLEDSLVGGDVSKKTHDTIAAELNAPPLIGHVLEDPGKALGMLSALLIGSPEFQQK